MRENTKNLTRSLNTSAQTQNTPAQSQNRSAQIQTNDPSPQTSQTSTSPLEDQWASVLKIYQEDPINALVLAQNFQAIKETLNTGPEGVTKVVHSMDEAIETLFEFTEIYKASHELFLLAVKGMLPASFYLPAWRQHVPP
jgi:Rad3-related DNA helicase